MRFLLSILVIALFLSGYEAASHVMGQQTTQKTNIEAAATMPCPDHHANNAFDGQAPNFEVNCHHCCVFPLGTAATVQKTVYPRKSAFVPARQAFVPNGLTFPLLRPPQSRA